jgi:hypothetical protein
MISSLLIAALCGLKYSVNPCILMTMACFLFLVGDFKRRGLNAPWYAAAFIATVFTALFLFTLGAMMPILYADDFFIFARRLYFVFGFFLMGCGIIHLREWWCLKRNVSCAPLLPAVVTTDEEPARARLNVRVIVPTIAAAVVLSALSTIWPPDLFITIQSTLLYLPGRFFETYVVLFVFGFALIVPFVTLFGFVSSGFFCQWVQKNPSMYRIILAAFTLSLGAGLVYVFR